jgi:8-oxo-dGTP diphosphatase
MTIDPFRSADRKKTRKEISAGGVVIKRDGDSISVLLISVTTRRGSDTGQKHYAFPKGGNGDHGLETLEETALREVREEGGVTANILEDLGEVNYFFSWEGIQISKAVRYYLMEYISGDPDDHDSEVELAEWIPQSEVMAKLTYKTDQDIFARAEAVLATK